MGDPWKNRSSHCHAFLAFLADCLFKLTLLLVLYPSFLTYQYKPLTYLHLFLRSSSFWRHCASKPKKVHPPTTHATFCVRILLVVAVPPPRCRADIVVPYHGTYILSSLYINFIPTGVVRLLLRATCTPVTINDYQPIRYFHLHSPFFLGYPFCMHVLQNGAMDKNSPYASLTRKQLAYKLAHLVVPLLRRLFSRIASIWKHHLIVLFIYLPTRENIFK